jgi:prevent-host-death family protein
MEVSIYEAKTHLSKLIEAVERGEEVIVSRRNKPVAKIVPASHRRGTRIGGLAGRPLKMGKGFDAVSNSEALGDLFGVPQK